MARDVFISYSHKDKAIADAICADLRSTRCAAGSHHAISPRAWTGQPPYRQQCSSRMVVASAPVNIVITRKSLSLMDADNVIHAG